jgi:uncharacterized protein involved in exopolysaccharide biosynthesis
VFRKLLEAFFKHKLLLLLPPVLITAIVAPITFLSTPPAYEAVVSVWIDRPAYLGSNNGTAALGSALWTQTGRLNELLRTRAFVTDVAQRTSLAPQLSSPVGQARAAGLIATGVTVGGGPPASISTPLGDHLLVIRVQAPTAQLAFELCKAVVDAFQERIAADQADQASVGVDFYTGRVQDAQTQLTKATVDLRRYVAVRQAADGSDPLGGDPNQSLSAAMLDPKLGALQSNLQAAQLDFNNAQAALNGAQQDAVMSAQGVQYGFQVMDPPELPVAPVSQMKKMIIYPIAALVAGLGIAGLLLVILVASDRSVRSELDLAPGLRSLGSVPLLQLKNVPKKLRSGATRRAIGAAAGMALPAGATASR